MTATPKQRAGLTVASFVVGHSVMAINHQGFIGAILAKAAGMAAWAYADEVFDKLNTGEPSAPPTGGTRATHGVMRRLLTTREQRRANGQQADVRDEEEQEAYQQREPGANDAAVDEDGDVWADDHFDELDEADDEIKTFRQLVEDKTILSALKRGEMALGYVGGELRFVTIKHFYSCGIGGVSGTGKSTTVRFLLFQFALLRARLVLIDPHIEDSEESLAAQFKGFSNIHAMPPCGEEASEVDKRVRILSKEYLRRKNNGIKGPPLILVIDELNGLMRRLPDEQRIALSQLILTLEGEARKFGMFCMLIGQRWSEQDLGGKPHGAAIRDSLASTIAHRFQSEEQAKKLIGSQYGRRCLALRNGHYLFRDTDGAVCEVYTPNTLSSDAIFVQRLLDLWREQAATQARVSEQQTGEELGDLRTSRTNPYPDEEEQTVWNAARDRVVMPVTEPMEQEQREDVRELPTPVMQEKGPRAEDIDLAAAITLWNNGYNSVRKLMRVFPGMTLHQAHRLSQMIEEEAKKRDEETGV
ncbi:MAG: DUF87 domain-containing protein [Chloroflexi bacterium]|nr:MAG: DUF87 domain-containing protein [Chloroflexota bacterium]